MATGRGRHVQQELFRHGGRRAGAGRKPKGARARAGHAPRPAIDETQALHVVLRVVREVGNLRRPEIYDAIRGSTVTAAKWGRIRLVHMSIQHDHVHLVVEADDKQKLADGIRGFEISAARNINRVLGINGVRRRGRVFADRYHLVISTTPTQTRSLVAYVLNNWRKHEEDRGREARGWMCDPYSSGRSFGDWRELDGRRQVTPDVPTSGPLMVSEPRSWMLTAGWKRAGTISAYEVPSQGREHRRKP